MKKLSISLQNQDNKALLASEVLSGVYKFYNDLEPVNFTEPPNDVLLARHALKRGYQAVIYTYNFKIFDPTWFGEDLSTRLMQQAVDDPDKFDITQNWVDFLDLGGEVRYETLSSDLIKRIIDSGLPLIVNASPASLYQTKREKALDAGQSGLNDHFLIVSGYEEEDFIIQDASQKESIIEHKVTQYKLIEAILLSENPSLIVISK